MTRSNEHLGHISNSVNNVLGSHNEQSSVQRTQSHRNDLTNAERSSQPQESPDIERSQVSNLPGWRSNLEVFASVDASAATDDSAALGGPDQISMPDAEQSMQVSGDSRRRNATCDRLLDQQLHAWQSGKYEDERVQEAGSACRARNSPAEAPGRELLLGETGGNGVSQSRRNAGELTVSDEDENEPGSIGAFLNNRGARKRGRHH